MTIAALQELKTTTKDLQSLIKTAKKQLLLVRAEEAEKNFSAGNFKVIKSAKDLLK